MMRWSGAGLGLTGSSNEAGSVEISPVSMQAPAAPPRKGHVSQLLEVCDASTPRARPPPLGPGRVYP